MTARAPKVAAIVLAAGRSSRITPRNKLLERIEGEPVIVKAVRAALGSGAHPVIVVTGHEAPRIAETLRGFDVELVHNPRFAEGMSTSLRTGIGALDEAYAGALVMLGDMPRVMPIDLKALLAAFAAANDPRAICVPIRGGRRGNPVLWGAAHFPDIMQITGDAGAKQLLPARGDDVIEVPAESDGIFVDIDVPADLPPQR